MTAISSARPAATIAILRAQNARLEILMLSAHERWFFPSTWSSIGTSDARPQVPYTGDITGRRSRLAVAGVRECLEEAGIWLGEERLYRPFGMPSMPEKPHCSMHQN